MILFGAGKLIAVPTFDALGAPIANAAPIVVGILQDVSVDISFEGKQLYGERQFPVAIGRGKGKISWKAKSGDFSGGLLGALVLGATAAKLRKAAVIDAAEVVPATGPYTVTIDPPSTGVFVSDLGVMNGLTGATMKRVGASPAIGEYSVVPATGIYTFASQDAAIPVLVSYEYSIVDDATSSLYTLSNNLMGYTPAFAALFYNQYQGKTNVMKLNNNVVGKLSLPFKNDDFTMSDIDADASADASNQVGYICQY